MFIEITETNGKKASVELSDISSYYEEDKQAYVISKKNEVMGTVEYTYDELKKKLEEYQKTESGVEFFPVLESKKDSNFIEIEHYRDGIIKHKDLEKRIINIKDIIAVYQQDGLTIIDTNLMRLYVEEPYESIRERLGL